MDYNKSKKLSGSVYGSNVMNYTWYYVVRINTKHKVAGTIYLRCVDSYHKVFCDLYNLGREV